MGNTAAIFSIFLFYTVIFVILGLMGVSEAKASLCNVNSENYDTISQDCTSTPNTIHWWDSIIPSGVKTTLSSIGFFFKGIFFSLSILPWWANMILFFPLGLAIVWAIAETIIP